MKVYRTYALAGAVLLSLATLSSARTAKSPPQASSPPAQRAEAQDARQAERELEKLAQEYSRMADQLQPKLAELQEKIAAQMQTIEPEITAKMAQLQTRLSELQREAAEKSAKAIQRAGRLQELVAEDEGGWLGLEIVEVTADKAKDLHLDEVRGVIVNRVEPDGPAAKAGLKENDVIWSYAGQAVQGTVQFRRLVRETPPGRSVSLTVIRDAKPQTINVELGAWSEHFGKEMERSFRFITPPPAPHPPDANLFEFRMPDEMGWHTPILGITAESLNGQLGEYFGAPEGQGILVREVRQGTPAEKAGLKAGDVIVKVDGDAVHSLRELRVKLRGKADQKSVKLGVIRKGSEITLPVAIEKPHPIGPLSDEPSARI